MNKSFIAIKLLWLIYLFLLVLACGTAVIMDNWIGYTYMALSCLAVFADDFKIVKGYWVQFVPVLLTILYLLYEHEPVVYIMKEFFS